MNAKDVMTARVISVRPDTAVAEIADTLVSHRISAVPVIDAAGRLVGIVSEGDLIRRPETGTEAPHRSWWLGLFGTGADAAARYVKSHGQTAADVMSAPVRFVATDMPLGKALQRMA